VDVKEVSSLEGKFAKWCDSVARNLGEFAGLASSSPSLAVILDGWPHEALGDELRSCLNPLPALTYQTVLDLNAACRSKRTEAYWLFSL